jgi:hypothetical protein
MLRRVAVGLAFVSLIAVAVAARQQPFRYDAEYPFIRYRAAPTTDRVALLKARIARGEVRLRPAGMRGYLDGVLGALDIDPTSQMLVFSKTSLQTGGIRAATPRAIYFNDDTYVAWVQGAGTLEIAAMDPALGPVFHTIDQRATTPTFERQVERCLACHDSFSLTGGGVPRFITGSGYTQPSGALVSHERWILTTHRTPLRSRWGGWYVTGRAGSTAHLGNMPVADAGVLEDLDRARRGTLASLDGLVDTSPYPAPTSDIVALLVLEHQITVQNAIVKANYEARGALDRAARGDRQAAAPERLQAIADSLLDAMFLTGEAPLPGPIAGSSGFAERFVARGPRDRQGRSLRDLDLQRRLFRYPLSYLVYSPAYAALPEPLRRVVERRIEDVLDGTGGGFRQLSEADRAAIRGILADTRQLRPDVEDRD